jgi:hypothetical protein
LRAVGLGSWNDGHRGSPVRQNGATESEVPVFDCFVFEQQDIVSRKNQRASVAIEYTQFESGFS